MAKKFLYIENGVEKAEINQDLSSTGSPTFISPTVDALQLDTSKAVEVAQGQVAWNSDEETFDFGMNGATWQGGLETFYHIRNNTGSTILNGTPVMAIGTLGSSGRILVAPFDGTDPDNIRFLIGFVTYDIPTDSDGKATNFGKVRDLNTSMYSDGNVLWASSIVIGGLTNVEPPIDKIGAAIAFVVHSHATQGVLNVRIIPLDEHVHALRVHVHADLQASIDEFYQINTDRQEPNGFIRTQPTTMGDISFVDGTRTFTIQPQGGESDFIVYCGTQRLIKTALETIVIDNTDGLHIIYYDTDGVLQSTIGFVDDIILLYTIVAVVYWNVTEGKSIGFGDERHGITMDGITHLAKHSTNGALYGSGLNIDGLSASGTGYTQTTSGVIWDEDIKNTPLAQLTHPFIYKEGASGIWNNSIADSLLGYNGGTGDMYWNEWTGVTWQLTRMTVLSNYAIVHFLATNDITYPVIKVMGQSTYSTRNVARDAIVDEIANISFNGLPEPEFVFLYSIIINRSGELQALSDGSLFVDFREGKVSGTGGASSSSSYHADLLDTDTDGHPLTIIDGYSIDGTLAANSDLKFSSEKAVKTYVDTNAYIHPATHPPSIIAETTGDKFVSDAQIAIWDAKQDALGFTPEDSANKGVAGGYAELDGSGFVPSAQLPSYVDDVLEYADFASFPVTGESGKIYVALDVNKTYRWSGTVYVEISESLALGETSATAYRGDRGKTAYDHSQGAHAPSTAEQNVNADWDSVSGDSEILNKPTTFPPSIHDHDKALAIDDRDVKPNTTGIAGVKAIKAFFTSYGGMTGAANADYQDLLVLDTYSDGSGGSVNALAFDKSTNLITHWRAAQTDTTWGTPEVLAYQSWVDSNYDTNVTTNLSYTRNTTSVTVVSSDGTDATLPAATTSLAGVLSSADKTKLDGISGDTITENDCVNGTFAHWQRGTSQTSSGYGSDDRWFNQHSGTTKTNSRRHFNSNESDGSGTYTNLGVDENPKYYSRTVVTSTAGASSFCLKKHVVLDVLKYAGKRVCVKFKARADAIKDIAIEGQQIFGSGGSTHVTEISPQKVTLSTSFQEFVVFLDFPSVSGETFGSTPTGSSVRFWFDAGSNYNTNTNTLGQQDGTFDLAEVEIYQSEVELITRRRTPEEELPLCQVHFWRQIGTILLNFSGHAVNSYTSQVIIFPVQMAGTPSIAVSGSPTVSGCTANTPVAINAQGIRLQAYTNAARTNAQVIYNSTASYLTASFEVS